MKRKPVKGEFLYSLNIGNAARSRPQKLRKVEVIKVGRKYFECLSLEYANSPHMAAKYYTDGWTEKTDYSPNSQLYESKQEYEDELEADAITLEIREIFSGYGPVKLTLEQLRKIKEIIKE